MKKPSGRALFALIAASLLLYAAFFTGRSNAPRQTDTDQKRTTTRLLMGTLVSISTWGVPDGLERQGVAAAFDEMARIDALMSSHKPESPVARLNRSAHDTSHPLVPELADLLREAQQIQKLSRGAFDPGLGELATLWGFSADPPATRPPEKNRLEEWLKIFHANDSGAGIDSEAGEGSGSDIELSTDPTTSHPLIRLANAATALDLGGIAKGYAIDRAIETLKAAGIRHALVNAGGDLRGIGRKGTQPWRVGIQHPRRSDRVIAVTLWPNQSDGDRAMVTSGDYERYFLHEGQRYHHLLDPKTGYPARSGLLSVSVQADRAALADGLSTAFFVLGEKETRDLLPTLPGVELMLIREDETHWQSEGFRGEWQGP